MFLAGLVCLVASGRLWDTAEISGRNISEAEWQRWYSMARDLQNNVMILRNQQFEQDFGEAENMTAFEGARVPTPILTPSNGCLSSNFSSDRCLRRIYSLLTWYTDNWSLVENGTLNISLVKNVKQASRRLMESLNRQLEVKDGQLNTSSLVPRVETSWARKMIIHSILFNFNNVLMDACRALRYISKRTLV